jgi:hypothetical protein
MTLHGADSLRWCVVVRSVRVGHPLVAWETLKAPMEFRDALTATSIDGEQAAQPGLLAGSRSFLRHIPSGRPSRILV